MKTHATLDGTQALTNKTINGLTPTAASVGFTIAGGTTSKTLTVPLDASVSGTNTGDSATPAETTTTVGALINGATEKTTPVDADMVGLMDSEASNVLKKLSWANIKATMGLYIYPVGAIYISISSTSPATLFGGTWAVFGAGKALISLNSADADFDTAEETGGAKTATISQANLPNINVGSAYGTNKGNGGTTGGGGAGNDMVYSDDNNNDTNAHVHSLGGSGTAMSIMNPYIVVYMWKRTA